LVRAEATHEEGGGVKTTEQLVIDYASNRAEFRTVKDEIKALMWPLDEDGCVILIPPETRTLADKMTDLRKNFFESDDYMYGFGRGWPDGGWIEVMEDSDITDPDMVKLAELWERRKKLVNEAGNIKRAICARGAKLLRERAT
jgi:hypothetical protein